jgi:hypothetical protein
MPFPILNATRYANEKQLIDTVFAKLGAADRPAKRIKLLRDIVASGSDASYVEKIKRMKSKTSMGEAAEEVRGVIDAFNELGAAGLFRPPSGRAGDFLINQSRGEWAEQTLAEGFRATGDYSFVSYGPSTPPMPGEDDYRRLVGIFGLITALEGKRPDGLLFESDQFNKLDPALQELASSGKLAQTPEDATVQKLVAASVAAVEVKSSVWLAKRRAAGTLSVTVKEEEMKPFDNWQQAYRKPIIFAQVFFDSISLLSYATIKAAITAGKLDGYVVVSEKDKSTTKMTYRLPLSRAREFAEVPFPEKSEAKFMIVGGANVAPYILYKGDPAKNLNLDLLRNALQEV